MTDTIIDLVRHGKPDGAAALYGRTDIALSSLGWQQLQQTCQVLAPSLVLTSPLRRCADFATDWAQQRQLPCRRVPLLQEFDFGEWDGIPFDTLLGEYRADDPGWQLLEAFGRTPATHTPPGSESLQDFHDRVVMGWQQLLAECAGEQVLLVCHAGVIRMILAHLLPVDWRDGRWFSALNIDYGSRTRIRMGAWPGATAVVECIGVTSMTGAEAGHTRADKDYERE